MDLVATLAEAPPAETADLVLSLLEYDTHTARWVNDGKQVWSATEYLLADNVQAQTGKPHPARPKKSAVGNRQDPERQAARERALSRKRARRKWLNEQKNRTE